MFDVYVSSSLKHVFLRFSVLWTRVFVRPTCHRQRFDKPVGTQLWQTFVLLADQPNPLSKIHEGRKARANTNRPYVIDNVLPVLCYSRSQKYRIREGKTTEGIFSSCDIFLFNTAFLALRGCYSKFSFLPIVLFVL